MRRFLNCGFGTQSCVLLLLAEHELIEPFEYAGFSDLGWEPKAVYETIAYMQSHIKKTPLIIIDGGDIRADALRSQVRGKAENGERWASMPLYVKKIWQPEEAEAFYQAYLTKGEPVETLFGVVEYYGHADDYKRYIALKSGSIIESRGMIKRQCTSEYKIAPIQRWIQKNMLGLNPGQHWPKEPVIEQVFGISYDERTRMKTADAWPKWAVFGYPFVELGWDRDRVILEGQKLMPGYVFPRSACVGCPFHSNKEWRYIRDNCPEEWADAVAFDRAIRNCGGIRGEMYIHRDCVPLNEADLDDEAAWDGVGDQECFGMCGV